MYNKIQENLEGLNMSKQYTKEFKDDAVRYYSDHKDIGMSICAKNLGISKSALSEWSKIAIDNQGEVLTRERGNYESDEAKENSILRKELRDTKDALEILKKAIGILGK